MNKILKEIEFAGLLVRKILGKQTEHENLEVDQWREDNADLYKRIFSVKNFENYTEEINQINVEQEWIRYQEKVNKNFTEKVKTRKLPLIIRYAASILIPALVAGSAIYFGFKDFNKEKESVIAETVISPGVKKAELILSNGKQIILDENLPDSIIEENGTAILSDSAQLDYQQMASNEVAGLYNELKIKKGWEWQLTLEDGTKVWINSMSRLKYPVHFTGNTREVELDGEAYFEVAHNPEKPFIVKTSLYRVEVLGTSFNISHYDNDEIIHTTLAEGKVKIKSNFIVGNDYIDCELDPDQQFYMNKTRMETGVVEVNSSVYTGWIAGCFVFEDETLENIFKELARWYEIDYFFKESDLRTEIFTGNLPKYDDFESILELMQKVSDVQFEVNENTILIK